MTFHGQLECLWFSSNIFGHMCLSKHVNMVFKQEWPGHECLITILTHPLRHTWCLRVIESESHFWFIVSQILQQS